MGEKARLVMVMHPVAEGRFDSAVDEIGRLDLLRAPPRSIRVVEEEYT
jgi:homoserine dehydrogenase